jgi:glucosamine--fructose-6-phosphate aminotransferase (isomerizing)
LAEKIYQRQSIYLLAKRESLAIAKEAALKIKELNYIHAEALGACEMKHGPIALIESEKKAETVVILFVLDNPTYEVMMNAVDQMASRNAFIVILTDCQAKIEEDNEKKKKEKASFKENYHFMINIPKMAYLSHLLSLIPMQIMVEKISKLKGINPDMPRNLAKTVTV